LEQYRQGFDVVYAVRTERKEGWLKRFSYEAFYRLIAAMADVPLPMGAGDFGLMSRRVVDLLRESPERHRYLRGLRTWVGFRQVGIPVERASRQAGQPKYNLFKLIQLAFDGIFAFSTMPLRLATVIGLLALGGSMLYAASAIFAKLFLAQPPQGFTTLIVAIVFLSGVQLLFLGIIGEYVGRIYDETKRRPTYVVQQVIRHSES
jgi:dolichol-phosphate mannosyltransferase